MTALSTMRASLGLSRVASLYATSGFANTNINAIPHADQEVRVDQSRHTNIFTCSGFISSGWRAAASMYLPPILPMPAQAPIAR